MDGYRFDAIAKALGATTSRRRLLRGLAGAAAGAAALVAGQEATAAARWGEISPEDGCCPDESGLGYRTYAGILWDIPWGQSWDAVCLATPAKFTDVQGTVQRFDRPTRCGRCGLYECGYFAVRDATCDGGPRCYSVGTAW